ncbi:MAG: phosphate acyltransferase PlsX [Ruminococcus sp.]|jgi:glycerol-3-phosphate acyltransferase PlsX|nr:phosphate acyltransferase PlsX [Ruminococcus sp.]
MIKIGIDTFGGDNAPNEVIKGARDAKAFFNDVEISLFGDEEKITAACYLMGIDTKLFEIRHAPGVMDIHAEPTKLLKEYKDSSMSVGLSACWAGECDAFVSAGSTGALVVGATFITKRLKGIKRVALSPLLPSDKGSFMLLDAGANTDCRPEMLLQFAVMGSAYMNSVMGIDYPKIGLLNIGSEDTKGRELEVEAYKLLNSSRLNFSGNTEARELPLGEQDVIVADGYTGNIALKLYEGMGSYFGKTLKKMLTANLKTKLGALLIMKQVNEFKSKMDYRETGGAVMLGASCPVIKAHGSSDARAFFNAIRQARLCVTGDIIGKIKTGLES